MKLGTLQLREDIWHLECEPHVAMWARRMFGRLPKAGRKFELTNTPQICADLKWFLVRFPLDVKPVEALDDGASRHHERILTLSKIVGSKQGARSFEMAVPPREYQRLAAETWLAARGLLLADDVGLGKTCSAIAGLTDPLTRPALVVTLAHLPQQWEKEINRFAPDLRTHILKKGSPYELPKFMGLSPDVLISSYHKLGGWCEVLAKHCKSIIFDEVQELRHNGTGKYSAASRIAEACDYRIGLSATPVYNYGNEMFNVMNVLTPDALGTKEEFEREWCSSSYGKSLNDPEAFGSFLREQHLMMRRTRKDVGRELPPLSRVTHRVDCDEKALKKVEGRAGELARLILSETKSKRGAVMHASEELNNLVRQATGIAKATYVAEFVRLLLEQDEPVVLYGWHRAVYEIWLEKLKEFRPVFYTGTESASAKNLAAEKFMEGGTNLMILSLRSGAGLDGLQKRCRTVVFGELDWSPGVMEQCIGRVARDGQTDPVMSYFLVSDGGSDPLMSETLGLKRQQIEGIRGERQGVLQRDDSASAVKRLAEMFLKKRSSK